MQTWTEVSGNKEPSVTALVAKVKEMFPENKEIIFYWEDNQFVFKKSHYQEDGFTVSESGDSWEFAEKIEKGLAVAGIHVTRGMSYAPGDEHRQNPNADRDISKVVAFEMNLFMQKNKSFAYKASALKSGCGVKFKGKDKYAQPLPPKALFDDLKIAIEAEFNVSLAEVGADGEVQINVLPYASVETWRELLERAELPEFALVGTDPWQTDPEKRKASQNLEAFMLAQGKMTMIRHGWISGFLGYEPMRERRFPTDSGGANFVTDAPDYYAIEGCYCRAVMAYPDVERRAKEGRISEGEIYQMCLPDVMAEMLIDRLRKAHESALGANERDSAAVVIEQAKQTATVHKINPMPKAVIDLQVGDRFAANGEGGLQWCRLLERTGDTCHAWVINGHWDLFFDLRRNVSLADVEHDLPEGLVSIVFTAPCPITHDVNYNEACDFVLAAIG